MPTQYPTRWEYPVPRHPPQSLDHRNDIVAHLPSFNLDQAQRRVDLEGRFGLYHHLPDDSDRNTWAVSDHLGFFLHLWGQNTYQRVSPRDPFPPFHKMLDLAWIKADKPYWSLIAQPSVLLHTRTLRLGCNKSNVARVQ